MKKYSLRLLNKACTTLLILVMICKESYFHWAFGVVEPACFGLIDVDSARALVFMQRAPPDYVAIEGALPTPLPRQAK